MKTTATSGNMITQYFGQNFDATKVDCSIFIEIKVYVPPSVRNDPSTTLFFNLEKNTMKEVSENDQMFIDPFGDIDADKTHVTANITGPFDDDNYLIRLDRKVTDEDIKNIKQDKMPGLTFSWHYNKDVELRTKHNTRNNQYTRLGMPSK